LTFYKKYAIFKIVVLNNRITGKEKEEK